MHCSIAILKIEATGDTIYIYYFSREINTRHLPCFCMVFAGSISDKLIPAAGLQILLFESSLAILRDKYRG